MAAYWIAAQRLPTLLKRRVLFGAVYGLLLYVVMNFIVLPLSAAGSPGFDNVPWVASSIVVHALLGIMCAWFAGRPAAEPAGS